MYRLDTAATLSDIRLVQRALQRVQDRRAGLLEATAQYGANLVRERVQNTGKNTEGETMLSSSAKKVGRYSESHGRVRESEGLRTDIINLTFSGELLNSDSWTVLPDEDGFGAGFREDAMSERASYQEDLFGDIFQLSTDEEEATAEYFNNALSDVMNTTF